MDWMAWTWPTAIFFLSIAGLLITFINVTIIGAIKIILKQVPTNSIPIYKPRKETNYILAE